jgi:hypothetical protein
LLITLHISPYLYRRFILKKFVSFSFVFVLILGLLLLNVPQSVNASANSPVADGSWNIGTEVNVDLTSTSAPSWLQLLTNGVKISAPAKICHPFRGGRFGWVGEIRQLVKGKWLKLATTNDWVPSKEGEFTSCAQAPAAGTYALFGYYIAPEVAAEEQDSSCSYDTSGWKFYIQYAGKGTYNLYGYFAGIPVGETVSYSVTSGSVIGTLLHPGNSSGSNVIITTVPVDPDFVNVDFKDLYFYSTNDEVYADPNGWAVLSYQNCQKTVPFTLVNWD